MKISANRLRGYVPSLTEDPRALRLLLDEAGIEVESIELVDSDLIIDVELLANRGDHRGYVGLAQEVAAALSSRRIIPTFPPLESILVTGPEEPDPAVLAFSELRMSVTDFAVISGAAPDLPPVLNIPAADLANRIGVLLGQPLHAYDADSLNGQLRVRRSVAGESADILGSTKPVELAVGTLVVADSEKVVAVAGVVGCQSSSATALSRAIVVESALYVPSEVRRSAMSVGVSTLASQRFERGGDGEQVIPALEMFAQQAQSWATPTEPIVTTVPYSLEPVWIAADAKNCSRLLGSPVEARDFAERLGYLGFVASLDGSTWLVPEWRRWDVIEPEDLYEEYARQVGYDALPESLPEVGIGAVPTRDEGSRSKMSEVLHAFGFFEVVTPGFYSRTSANRLSLPPGHPLKRHVATVGSHDKAHSLLKNNTLIHALDTAAYSERQGSNSIKLYEFTRIFHPDEDPAIVDERHVLWAYASGRVREQSWNNDSTEVSVHYLIGLVQEIARILNITVDVRPISADNVLFATLHPHRSAELFVDGMSIGVAGEVHPGVAAAFELRAGVRPVILQVDTELLLEGPRHLADLSGLAPVVRMLDLVKPESLPAADLKSVLIEAAPPWLRSISVNDVFHPDSIAEGEVSITYKIDFEPGQERRVLDYNTAVDRMLANVMAAYGSAGVRLR